MKRGRSAAARGAQPGRPPTCERATCASLCPSDRGGRGGLAGLVGSRRWRLGSTRHGLPRTAPLPRAARLGPAGCMRSRDSHEPQHERSCLPDGSVQCCNPLLSSRSPSPISVLSFPLVRQVWSTTMESSRDQMPVEEAARAACVSVEKRTRGGVLQVRACVCARACVRAVVLCVPKKVTGSKAALCCSPGSLAVRL